MTDATASLSNYRQSPRKVRLVADLVRGKTAAQALQALEVLPKRASEAMAKLIKSAVANAQSKGGASAQELVISRIEVNGGIVFRRSMPRARGRASAIRKKTSHITLALSRRAEKLPAKAKPSVAQE
jgi:large subunit ribosomal protein L22